MAREDIPALLERVREISESDENRRKRSLWGPESRDAKDHWRGTPRSYGETGIAPFTVEPECPMWAKIIGFDVVSFYTDPDYYVENTLRITIYRHEHFKDCTPVDKGLTIWLGSTLESSLFGAETIYRPGESPWLDREPVIRTEDDLARLSFPDFYHSGLMPLVHRFFDRVRELVDDDFPVTFPVWHRSPWGVAFHLRRIDNLVVDAIENPGFVHRMMRFFTDARKQWWIDRAQFLGEPTGPANLYNDEVNCPTISPALYEEFILPYEQELSEFHGGIGYWHSCGDTAKLLELIDRIPNFEMFNVGPWTNLERVVAVLGDRHPLEICLNAVADVQTASPEFVREKLRGIMHTCGNIPYTVRADTLQDLQGLDVDIPKIQTWIETARELLVPRANLGLHEV